jgi:hypothetical protein
MVNRSSAEVHSRAVRMLLEPSVGRVGDRDDDTLVGTINGLFKAPVIHRRGPWPRARTVDIVSLEWVDWLNNRRFIEPISPAEADACYQAQACDHETELAPNPPPCQPDAHRSTPRRDNRRRCPC